ncbi:hypothetical protein HAAEEKHM_00089 [Sinorhizobium phage AP-16-3]|nr:hypothetical protein HAAEEKHM_00089 [Sinorhizobium phage AP-16-3]
MQRDRWKTKKAKQEHFSKILQEARLGEHLTEHYKDLLNLLREHPAADEKIGVGVLAFKVDLVPPYFCRGFYIIRADGTSDDFSYRICLNGRPTAAQKTKRAFRNEIFPQIDAFRRVTFANGEVACTITGKAIDNASAEVDHAPPETFSRMMADFLAINNLRAEDVETISHDGGVTHCVVDDGLRKAWQDYHAEHATLRAVSAVCHKLVHANDNNSKTKRAA